MLHKPPANTKKNCIKKMSELGWDNSFFFLLQSINAFTSILCYFYKATQKYQPYYMAKSQSSHVSMLTLMKVKNIFQEKLFKRNRWNGKIHTHTHIFTITHKQQQVGQIKFTTHFKMCIQCNLLRLVTLFVSLNGKRKVNSNCDKRMRAHVNGSHDKGFTLNFTCVYEWYARAPDFFFSWYN